MMRSKLLLALYYVLANFPRVQVTAAKSSDPWRTHNATFVML